jgi:hypothetical protein
MAKAVKKSKKKKRGLRGMSGAAGAGAAGSSLRPQFVKKTPPCVGTCPNQNAIREMLMAISKAEDLEKSYEQAFEEAFYIFMETTPFLSVCGRVCPHPCEGEWASATARRRKGRSASTASRGSSGISVSRRA